MSYFILPPSMKLRQTLCLLLFLLIVPVAKAQEQEQRNDLEVYGYVKTDIGYSFDQVDPNWIDILSVTKLPQYQNQFAPDGKIYFSVRQTRMGLSSWSQTPMGQLKINFEFDLFGVGPDVGQTTFRFRKAYAELGRFTVGQTESLFSDIDVTPNTLDFGAPPSRPYLRTIQVRYMRVSEQHRWGVALEQPGAVTERGIYAERIELQNVRPAFRLPDLSAQYRWFTPNGYLELAGLLKWIRWENTVSSPIDLSGSEIGWGFNITSTQHLTPKTLLKAHFVYGKGVENHLTDAGSDVGIQNNFDDPTTPLLGAALPVTGGLAFLEHSWTSKWSSTLGYSRIWINNSDAQAASAFKNGHYAIANLLYQPFPQFLAGAELQWGKRNNFSDGFDASAVRVQFSVKHSFSHSVFEKTKK